MTRTSLVGLIRTFGSHQPERIPLQPPMAWQVLMLTGLVLLGRRPLVAGRP